MPDNKPGSIGDFELPPLPPLPTIKKLDPIVSAPPQEEEKPKEKPRPSNPFLDAPAEDEGAAYEHEEHPADKAESTSEPKEEVSDTPSEDTAESDIRAVSDEQIENAQFYADSDGTLISNADTSPVPPSEPATEETAQETKEEYEDPSLDFEGHYEEIDLDNPGEDYTEKIALAPMTTNKAQAAKNLREKIKMDDLANDIGAKPILDDLSDEYLPPEKKVKNLADQEYLDKDEKLALKRKTQEDLARRPENFNARQSKKMYNKLMEEKRLKIAKKGLALSFIPIILGLVSAAATWIFKDVLNFKTIQLFQYIALFVAAGALLLLIKSKQVKTFATVVYGVSLVFYIGLGVVIYFMNLGDDPVDPKHLLMTGACMAPIIAAMIMLVKSESINIYYSTKLSKR